MENSIGLLSMKDGWIIDNILGSFHIKPGTVSRLWILCEQIPQDYLSEVDPDAHYMVFDNNEHWVWFHFLGWREIQTFTIHETIEYIREYKKQHQIDTIYTLGACNGSFNALHFGFLLGAKWIGAMAPLTSLLGEDHPVGKSFSSFHSHHAKQMLLQVQHRNLVELDYFRVWNQWNKECEVSFFYYKDNIHHVRALQLIPSDLLFGCNLIGKKGNKHIEIVEELHAEVCKEIGTLLHISQNDNVSMESPKQKVGTAQYRFIQAWNQPRYPGFFRPNDTFFILLDERNTELEERRAKQWAKYLKYWHVGPKYFISVRYHEENDGENQIEYVYSSKDECIPFFDRPKFIQDEHHNIFILPGHWNNVKSNSFKKSRVYQDDWQSGIIEPRSIFSQRIVGLDTFYFPFIWDEFNWNNISFPQNPTLISLSFRTWNYWKSEAKFIHLLQQWDNAGFKVAICSNENICENDLNELLDKTQIWIDQDVLFPLHDKLICKVISKGCIPFILMSNNKIPVSIFPKEWYIYIENPEELEKKAIDIWMKPLSYWEYPWSRLIQEFQNSKFDANLNIARWLGYWTTEQIQLKLSQINDE